MATRTMRKMLRSVSLFAMLLVVRSVGFGQTTFGDSISLLALVCTEVNDRQNGDAANDFELSKTINSKCSKGNASSEGIAGVGTLFLASSDVTTSAGSAASVSTTFDTALLKPPSGFTGTFVNVGFSATETFTIKGVVFPVAAASAEICWLYTGISKPFCHKITSNGNSTPMFSTTTAVKKTSTGAFKLFVELKTDAGAANGASATATAGPPFLTLPKNWTYKWASGE